MRLKQITLCGFKSFADKTTLLFDAPITAIVGPNGCGKSNVVDAIKWVLGEQSAKTLRGGAMLDVIFNGTTARKPAGLAEVTLCFENPPDETGQRRLPVETDEVAITRRLFRDGTSEYLVNHQKARLRDIRELFFDTGLGTNAYAIIEQGKIDTMLTANPVERRVIFEEAAGISKFKQRKKETLRKLERTEQNLLRCRDKLEEVSRRLHSVKIQAGRARTYQQYTARLNELRLLFFLDEYHRLQQQLAENAEQLRQADLARRSADDQLAAAEQQRHQVELQRQQHLDRQRSLENRKMQLTAERDQARQRRRYAESTIHELQQQIDRDRRRADELAKRRLSLQQQIHQQQECIQQLQDQHQQASRRIDHLTEQQTQRRHQLNETAARLEDEKAGIVNLLRRTTALHNEINSIDLQSRNLVGHRDRLTSRANQLAGELADLLQQRDRLQEQLSEVLVLINGESTRLAEQKQQAEQLHGRTGRLARELENLKEQRVALETRRATLQELEEAQTGLDEAVKTVLARKSANGHRPAGEFAFVRGLLADMIQADLEHAPLVEAALGHHAQCLLVERLEDLTDHRDLLQSLPGRVTFWPLDRPAGFRHDVRPPGNSARRLLDHVQCDPAVAPLLWQVLGTTWLVDDLETACRLHRIMPAGQRFITRAGELLEADGRLHAGPLQAAAGAGIISRRSQLADLARRIEQLDRRIADHKATLARLSDRSAHFERTMQELRQAIYEASTMRVELTGKLEQATAAIEKIEREQPVIAAEVEQIHRQLQEADRQRHDHQQKMQQLEADQADSRRRVEQLEKNHHRLTEQVNELGEQLTAARIEAGQISEQIASAGRHLRQLEIALNDCDRQSRELAGQIEHHHQRLGQLQDTVTQADAQIEGLTTAIGRLDQELAGFQEQLRTFQERLGQLNQAVAEYRRLAEQAEQQVHEARMTDRELEVRRDSLHQRAQETLGLDVVTAYCDYQPRDIDRQAVQAEIQDLQRKVDRLGHVNLQAIEEQDELEQRQQFLAEQVGDIDRARRELEQLIVHLDNESRQRFEMTFNQVREHFAGPAGMFRKLFGGGRADLLLIPDENGQVDWLESGVDIIAKPPGKEPQTINLLSGGERTMVAVALLMSLFRSRPSPFCVLDEVDAALDDANVDRFCHVLRGFLDQSHFIIITHNKHTMAIADQLYGITMPQRGVSRQVAVKIEHIGDDGRIHSPAPEDRSAPVEPQIVTDPQTVRQSLESPPAGDGTPGPAPTPRPSSAARQRLAQAFEEKSS